jgi:diketogulonate reductase-like aldo/keto reductase
MKEINGHRVNPIGIGTWTMGAPTRDQDIEAVQYSITKGQNHIDTAEIYGDGEAEEVVGKAIAGVDRANLFIATKIWRPNARKKRVVPAVQAMLRRLRTDYIDLLYIHAFWSGVSMEGYLEGMNEAVDMGLVRGLGVSNFDLEQLQQAMVLSQHPIVAVQNHYNVINKSDVPPSLLQFCQQNNLALIAYRPVELDFVSHNAVVQAIASRRHATPSQVALSWLLQQDAVHAIPKAAQIEHIDENLGALDLRLTADEVEELNSI